MKELTIEERERLELERCEAKLRCMEVWDTINKLREITRSYEKTHRHWKWRYEKADRALAEVDKLTISKVGEVSKKVDVELTNEQLLSIAAQLGIDLENQDD